MAAVYEAPQVSANDRLMFTTFLAGVLHAILILGIGWSYMEHKMASPSLEIVLAQHKSELEPEEADFLAQVNQQGSGTLEEKREVTTTEMANFEDNVVRKIDPVQQQATQKPRDEATKLIATTAPSRNKTAIKTPEEIDPETELAKESNLSLLQRSLEIASLEAELAEKRQEHAKRPRKRQLTALTAKSAVDSFYLKNWQDKVERIGNLFYPRDERRKKMFGDVRIMVALNPKGEVQEVKILRSSGKRSLDQATIDIVRRASPYATFPKEMRETTDILEIIRTFKYEKDGSLSSS